METEDIIGQCEKYKNEGNEEFKKLKYETAVERYCKSIEIMIDHLKDESEHNSDKYKKLAIYYSNRAAVHLKMENYGLAINDADEAINYDPNYPKSYYRKADGLISIDKYKEARACLKRVVIEMKV